MKYGLYLKGIGTYEQLCQSWNSRTLRISSFCNGDLVLGSLLFLPFWSMPKLWNPQLFTDVKGIWHMHCIGAVNLLTSCHHMTSYDFKHKTKRLCGDVKELSSQNLDVEIALQCFKFGKVYSLNGLTVLSLGIDKTGNMTPYDNRLIDL